MLHRSLLPIALLLANPLIAQSTEADIQARLIHKPLYLRGQWSADKLRFDSSGQRRSRSDLAPFTVSAIDIKSIDIKGNSLQIDGTRVGLKFDGDNISRLNLSRSMRIEIDAPPSGDYSTALDAIFTSSLSDFVATLPTYWQQYAHEHFPAPAVTPSTDDTPLRDRPVRGGGAVSPPVVLYAPAPEWGQYSREIGVRVSGQVVVYLQIGPDGQPSHVRILRPMGLSLDEKAVEAVSQYRFKPAQENGKPVRVEMNVAVNFQVF